MHRSFRAARFLVALSLIALVAACSFSRFGYNQADTLAAWMVDDYFDLDATQKQDFQKRFDRFYTWHRNEQLPEYATFLRTARGKLSQGLTREDVLWFVDGVRARVRTAARRAGPEAAAFLATVTPEQMENLRQKWDKDNKKYLKENKVRGTPEERHEVEAKKVVKTFKEWLTPLNSEQEQKVAQMVRELPSVSEFRYAERLRRQKEFMTMMQQRTEDREKFAARVTEWLANWDRGRSAEDQKKLDAWWQKRAEIFVALDKSITREQRVASLERVQRYIDDCVHLARRDDGSRTASTK
jgi:hypothetical protein